MFAIASFVSTGEGIVGRAVSFLFFPFDFYYFAAILVLNLVEKFIFVFGDELG